MKKDIDPKINEHGKAIVNWQLSLCIYAIVAIILCFIVIIAGYPYDSKYLFCSVFCPILTSIKIDKDNGNLYSYPMTLYFLK